MTVAQHEAVDVILRDGGTLRLREPGEGRSRRARPLLRGLSQRSLFLRFHGIPRVDARLVEPVLDPDWAERGALLASVADDGEDRIVALANYVRLRDPRSAEVAFAVADDHQGRGIATRMLERLAAFAGRAGSSDSWAR
jgi:RimJ/RimL family protein N-acetyltransferase